MRDGVSVYFNYSNPNDILLNLGANINIVKRYARSESLSAGDTDAAAESMQHEADSFPVLYSLIVLNIRAKRMWKTIYSVYPQHTVVDFNVVAITTNPDGTLQDHLIESFTCTSATNILCDTGSFGKLVNYKVTPWFKEAVAHESLMSRRARH